MGEDDVLETDSSPSKNSGCRYQSRRRDCDGDWDNYCTNYGEKCPYKKCVRDVDRDIVELCRK